MSENAILSKLEGVKHKFDEIGQQITDPDVIADMKKYVALNKEYRELEPIVEVYAPGEEKVTYVNMTTDKVATVVREPVGHRPSAVGKRRRTLDKQW